LSFQIGVNAARETLTRVLCQLARATQAGRVCAELVDATESHVALTPAGKLVAEDPATIKAVARAVLLHGQIQIPAIAEKARFQFLQIGD
jgi:hypothetical protein